MIVLGFILERIVVDNIIIKICEFIFIIRVFWDGVWI